MHEGLKLTSYVFHPFNQDLPDDLLESTDLSLNHIPESTLDNLKELLQDDPDALLYIYCMYDSQLILCDYSLTNDLIPPKHIVGYIRCSVREAYALFTMQQLIPERTIHINE